MTLIVKNTTGSEIFIQGTGETIPASGQRTIDPKAYAAYAGASAVGAESEDATFTSEINTGDIVINNGNVDLTAAQAFRYLSNINKLKLIHDSTTIDEAVESLVFTGENVSVTNPNPGQVQVQIGDTDTEQGLLFSVGFHIDGNDEFAELLDTQRGTNQVPFVFPYGAELRAFTWTNEKDDVNTDLEIRKNGTGSGSNVAVYQIRGKQFAYKNDISGISFNIGDELAVYFDNVSGGDNPGDGYLQLFFRITDDTPSEDLT